MEFDGGHRAQFRHTDVVCRVAHHHDAVQKKTWTSVHSPLVGCVQMVFGLDQDHLGNLWPENSYRCQKGEAQEWLTRDGHVGALLQVRSDLENYSKEFALQHHSSNEPCFRCAANRSAMPWTAVPPGADWTSHCHSNAA